MRSSSEALSRTLAETPIEGVLNSFSISRGNTDSQLLYSDQELLFLHHDEASDLAIVEQIIPAPPVITATLSFKFRFVHI